MFSQRSFGRLDELPPPRSVLPDHTTPFEEEDDFDLDDPRFPNRSRASSIVTETGEEGSGEVSRRSPII